MEIEKIESTIDKHLIEESSLVDINSADVSELEKLPAIGRSLAERIVAHREKHGRFRRVEHLLVVKGMSEAKFRKIRHLLTTKKSALADHN